VDERKAAEQSELKPHLLIDVLLYPISVAGGIHLLIFWLAPLLITLLGRLLPRAGPYGGVLTLLFYIVLTGYMFYYLGECVRDSAAGGVRAPDISTQAAPDRGDLLSQEIYMLGCIAVCFCPVVVYRLVTGRIDVIFWVLAGCGIFFFPMALLAVAMFDSMSALNPLLLIGSILSTFLPYCGLVLLFCGLGGLVALAISTLPQSRALGSVFGIAFIYLAMVTAHILGRFYWRYKEKLYWEA